MLVKVAVCKDAFEGEVVKGLLAANDIDCHLQNETMSQIYGGIPAFAINVLVKQEDAEKAKQLLDARNETGQDKDEPQMKQKPLKRIILESLMFAVIVLVLMIVAHLLGKNLQPAMFYFTYGIGAFLGWFLTQLLFWKAF